MIDLVENGPWKREFPADRRIGLMDGRKTLRLLKGLIILAKK